MHVLDTDTLTRAHGGHAGIAKRVREVGEENVATTIISTIETLRGRHEFMLKANDGAELLRAQQLLQRSEELLQSLPILLVDSGVAAQFDKLRENRRLKKIGRRDLLIACISLAQDATLVTRNLRHFRQVPGLSVENWID
jgi:tRNA(fMet)-specific endonuclease VapC